MDNDFQKELILFRKDPATGLFRILMKFKSDLKAEIKSENERMIKEAVAEMVSTAGKQLDEMLKSTNAKIEDIFTGVADGVKKLKSNEKIRGFKGPKGDRGIPGSDGKNADEEKIVNKVYSKIRVPKDGKDGRDGKDGSPDKPEQIATKLNTLEEKVDQKVIKGLPKLLDSVNQAIRESKNQKSNKAGGGMGGVQTYSTNLTSVTTSISLPYNIASNGKAIWFNYQGQQQQLGVHFTISGKVITLLFTPADNTVADIIYIRT